jgi:hypothetical protein
LHVDFPVKLVASVQSVDYHNFNKKRGAVATVSIRSKLLAAVALLSCTVALPACYTILQHPRLAQLDYQRPAAADCRTCHTRDDLWRYVHPSGLPAQPGAWHDSYNTPWWNEHHWGRTPADSTREVR